MAFRIVLRIANVREEATLMRARTILFILAVVSVSLCGCTYDGPMDQLWREGYGFNNPNTDRIRQGLPPESF